MNFYKKGLTTIEWVVVTGICLIFAIFFYFTFVPDELNVVWDGTSSSLLSVLNPNEDGGTLDSNSNITDYAESLGTTTYPSEDDWSDVSDFTYTVTATDVTITGYIGSSAKVVIPEEIDGVSVTAIASNAFQSKGLTSVSIPSTVLSIGSYAFASNNLTTLSLPTYLEIVGDCAFMSNSISALYINTRLTSIGASAFRNNQISVVDTRNVVSIGSYAFNNNILAEITLGSQLTSIGENAFTSQDADSDGSTRAGIVIINTSINLSTSWDLIFDEKFNGSRP